MRRGLLAFKQVFEVTDHFIGLLLISTSISIRPSKNGLSIRERIQPLGCVYHKNADCPNRRPLKDSSTVNKQNRRFIMG